jgi:hypothetical protein
MVASAGCHRLLMLVADLVAGVATKKRPRFFRLSFLTLQIKENSEVRPILNSQLCINIYCTLVNTFGSEANI